jgi:AraC-like DNA-binding protein
VASRTVAIQFIHAAIESARSHGLDLSDALRDAQITAELLSQDSTRVTPAQANRLIQAMWVATDDELFGAGPRPVPRGTFKMMTLGLIHAPDLKTAIHRYVEFSNIATRFEAVGLEVDETSTRLYLDPTGHTQTDRLLIDVLMAVFHRFSGWLIGEQISLDSVDLPGAAPAHAAEYLLIYGVAPAFESRRAAITFSSRYLSAPVIRSEDDLMEFIRTSPNDLLFRQDYQPTTSSRVRRMIERRKADEAVTVDDVAKRLTISAQHLRRLLRDEGTSFRGIKEEILRDEAIASLVRGGETVEEISERLGFSEPSAFRRAFRRWTGNPPGSYRPVAD